VDVLSTVGEIVRDLLIVIGVLAVLLVALVIITARMAASHPMKRWMLALTYRVGATLAASVLAVPIEPVPGLDVLYDIGAPAVLLIYWISLFRHSGRLVSGAPPRPGPKILDNRR
jgi:hypothetical protein